MTEIRGSSSLQWRPCGGAWSVHGAAEHDEACADADVVRAYEVCADSGVRREVRGRQGKRERGVPRGKHTVMKSASPSKFGSYTSSKRPDGRTWKVSGRPWKVMEGRRFVHILEATGAPFAQHAHREARRGAVAAPAAEGGLPRMPARCAPAPASAAAALALEVGWQQVLERRHLPSRGEA